MLPFPGASFRVQLAGHSTLTVRLWPSFTVSLPGSVEEVFQLVTALEAQFLQGFQFDLTYPLTTDV